MARIGRNEPCPCGSGKKFKRCCALVESTAKRHDLHELDNRLALAMLRWGRAKFPAWNPREDYPGSLDHGAEADLALAGPWMLYEQHVEGRPIVSWFYEEFAGELAPCERAWLEAQKRASLSIWEVLEVERDRGLHLRDLFTGDDRFVHEVLGSRSLGVRDAVLARVVDGEGTAVFCGMYPRSLPPRFSAAVVDALRTELRTRRGSISRDRLRDPEASSVLIEEWEDAVEALDSRPLPKLMNTDGEELLLTVDRFDLGNGARAEVIARVSRLKGAQPPEEDEGATQITFEREGNAMNAAMPSTLLGTVRVEGARLTVETNSIKRANRLRGLIEEACGERLRHRVRDHSDPEALLGRARNAPPRPLPQPEGAHKIIQEYKAKHYASWLDSPIPALAGKTPRQAAKSARLRRELDLLLREMENREGRLPKAEQFDVSALRTELGV